jgi:hypothetical protein
MMLQHRPRATRNFRRTDLRTSELDAALTYWEGLCALHHRLPCRQEVDPVKMRAFLPYVILVDVLRDGRGRVADFHFRLSGTEVAARYGCDLRGLMLTEVDLGDCEGEIMAAYLQTVAWGAPQYFVDAYVRADGRPMHYERLLMPLSSDGFAVDVLLGVQKSLLFSDAGAQATQSTRCITSREHASTLVV